MKWPVAVDLFSGMGGLTLGLKRARFRVVAAVERDPLAASTYRANHKSVRLHEADIRDITGDQLLTGTGVGSGQVDLVAGCPPCQGFSTLRTRNSASSVDDERNDLVFEFLRIVEDLRPRAVLMENVPRLRDDPRHDKIADRLRVMGYETRTQLLDASNHGVPQRRKRMILTASRIGPVGNPAEVEQTETETVRAAIGQLSKAGTSGDPAHDHGERRSKHVRDLIRAVPVDGGSRSDLPPKFELDCHKTSDGFSDVYGRMSWDDPAPTITGGCVNPSKGRFLHPSENRSITVREAAVLQGFPSDYQISMDRGKYAAAQLVGNALPPAFAECQAAPIRTALIDKRRRQHMDAARHSTK